MTRALVLLALLLAAPAWAKEEDFRGGSIVFARDSSLWKTDPKGKGPAVEIVALPGAAKDVRMIRTDAAGAVILFDLGGAWWWARYDAAATAPAKPEKLGCADAPARLTRDGRIVVCADADGRAMLIGLVTGKIVRTRLPADGARVVVDGARELLWADADGIWAAPLRSLKKRREVAPEPPLRSFLAAPDGSRGVGVYAGHVFEKRQKVPADVLDGFALDGTASRRMLHRDAVVIDWSWDSQWVLVQLGDQACVTRAVGGQYKCWEDYRAVSIAEDGRWVVLLGKRRGGEDGEQSVYRGRLEGAYTDRPSLVETVVDGAALWLPGPVDVAAQN